ncbi:hypothetical protein [Yinghuangia sp. YIM S10712]|uniref:hypothetical protein n=1 Tax=Yinghuangia sp. YIM S10712 TaxID=3436930 RepID=UPI003F52C0E5
MAEFAVAVSAEQRASAAAFELQHEAKSSGFAGAVGSDERRDVAGFHHERQIVDGDRAAVPARQFLDLDHRVFLGAGAPAACGHFAPYMDEYAFSCNQVA